MILNWNFKRYFPPSRKLARSRAAIAKAAGRAFFERLEDRRLFSTYTFNVPSGHSVFYLEAGSLTGQVDVHEDTRTGFVAYTFSNQTGEDIVDCGALSGITIHDEVAAGAKPTSDANGDNGIKMQNGSGGTLVVDAQASDALIEVTNVTSTSAIIHANDGSNDGHDRYGSGVAHLTIIANDAANATINVADFPYASLVVRTGAGSNDTINLGIGDGTINTSLIVFGSGSDNTANIGTNNDGDDPVLTTVDCTGTGSGNGLGLGNQVNVGPDAVATLAQAAGSTSHTVVIDGVNVGSVGTLVVGNESTVGAIQVDNGGQANVEAPLTVASSGSTTGTFGVDGTAEFTGPSGSSTIDHFANSSASSGTVSVDSGASVTVLNSSSMGTLNVAGTMTLDASTSTSVNNIDNVYALNLSGSGLLALAAYYTSTSNDTVLVLNTTPSIVDSAKLDLSDNFVIVNDDSSTSLTNLRNLLINGRNGAPGSPGSWDGAGGIGSSYAHDVGNGFNLAVGYADNVDLGNVRTAGSYTVFGGQTVSANDVLIRMTRGADATLDGVVDAQDVTTFNAHYNKPGSGQWCFCDFDYSGTCDSTDVTTLGSTFGKTTPLLAYT